MDPRGRSGHGRSCSGALGGDKLSAQGRAFQFDPMGAMNDAVEDRVTERGVGDHLVPFTDRDLAGDQQRPAVVAVVNDLEQIAALLGIKRLRPPIIDDQEPDAFERGEQPRQAALAARLGQIAEQAAGAFVEHREALAAGLVAEGTSQPRLADTGRTDDHQMMMIADPLAGGELVEQGTVETARGMQVDVFDRKETRC